MFERFTERARQTVALAQEEARALKHNYIGTEHILLGLLREEDGLAARILGSLGITVERVRGQVVRIVGGGEEVTPGQIPLTPRATRVLELALREALSLGHNFVGTEHVLLGLVCENEGVGARILLDFDVDAEKIRREVIRVAGAAPTESPYQGRLAEPRPRPVSDQLQAAPSDVELGWRSRPRALAALGAAVLARMAFDRTETGHLTALEMQVLAHLALVPPVATLTGPGELFESLVTALACDRDDLRDAVRTLTAHQLVRCQEEHDDDQRVAITTAGFTAVQRWLAQTAPLFGEWPPDHAAADDAIG